MTSSKSNGLQPPANCPPRIRTDASNRFAQHTMRVRVPAIVRDVARRNPDYVAATQRGLEALAHSLETDEPLPAPALLAIDQAWWQPAWEARRDETWGGTDWLFAEMYVYHLITACTQYWALERDPFASHKAEEYADPRHWERARAALNASGELPEQLHELLGVSLWGNRIDLSFVASRARGLGASEADVLADQRDAGVQQLLQGSGPVHLIADNAGTELAMDLILVDRLLEGLVDQVVLHLKAYPIYVSDATAADVRQYLSLLGTRDQELAALGRRLSDHIAQRRLVLAPQFFYCSSYSMWEMPPALAAALSPARLVILKGDANYRRLVGDAVWPTEIRFSEVAAYFPAPLLALRTLKSDAVVGLTAGQAAQLDASDPQWRVNGRYGLMQYAGR